MIIPSQDRFRPSLPIVMGNVDYREFERQLKRINEILKISGVENDFVKRSLDHWAKTTGIPLEKIFEKDRVRYQQPPCFRKDVASAKITLGHRHIFLVFTLKGHKIRILSARYMHQKEVKKYGAQID